MWCYVKPPRHALRYYYAADYHVLHSAHFAYSRQIKIYEVVIIPQLAGSGRPDFRRNVL